ncbi:MAG: hypothetical protein LBV50_00060 [Novosphingobium sp.]|jgi:hypothetical protein|nr:hypothetical protein [Novosphingobium sp.]
MSNDPAKVRLMALHAMRWSGLALVIFGLMALYGRIALPREIASALVIVGLIDALIMPTVFARRWKSPPP